MKPEAVYNLPEHQLSPKQIRVRSALDEAKELKVELYGFWLHMKRSGRGLGGLDYSPVYVRRTDESETYFWRAMTKEGKYEERTFDPRKTPNGSPIESTAEFLSE